MKLKTISALAAAGLFFTTPLCSCTKTDKEVIRISEVTHSVFYAPFYLSEALGYLEEEGLSLSLTNGGGADNVMASLLSGDTDIGFCGPEAALYVLSGGSTDIPKVIGQLTKRDGSFLVSRKAEPDFKWEDLKGKEILAGRKGGVPAMTFEYVLNEHGLTNGTDVTLNFDVAFNLMTSAFEGGTADYCTMFEPTASDYEKAGKGYKVASVGEASGEIPYTCFIARESWLKKKGDTAEKFLTAVTKACKYAMEADAADVAKLLAPYFTGTDVASLQASVESYKAIDAWKTNLEMTKDSFLRLEKVIDNAGELDEYADYDLLTDNSYAQAAYKTVYSR